MFSVEAQTFTTTPSNTAVLKDATKPVFQCKSDQEAIYMNWLEKKVAYSSFTVITSGGKLLPVRVTAGYTLDNTNGNFHLSLLVSATTQAGDYRCQVINPTTNEATAKLTVLGRFITH